ncbi:MAG: hypothetical protein QM845_02645 [Verrucomicrobiota bacterium]|nr:hypothetical protein [Verrucomicrobiota bacterium]
MPIKGLSETRRFSRGGKIRLGEKKVSQAGKEYPAKLDHFLFDPIDPNMLPVFEKLFGPAPKELTVAFASEDREQVFPQYYKCYGASGLLCKGDGETAMRRDKDSADLFEIDCPGPANCEYAVARGIGGRPGCKQVASLQFFLPDLPTMQVWQIDTSSYNSIVNINSQLDIFQAVAGRISFVPVTLRLSPRQATNPENGKPVNIYVLDLVIGVGLRQIGQLKPLLAYAGAEVPAPTEALPDDLYPRSQCLPAPDAAPVAVDDEDGPDPVVDEATGEILDSADEPHPFEADLEVQAALDGAGFTPAKREAMLRSAIEGDWPKEQLLKAIGNNTPKNGTAKGKAGRAVF